MFSFLKGSSMAKQLGAETYLECSAFTSEKSIHSVFRTAALACMNKLQPANKPSPVRRLSKRLLHLPSKTELLSSTFSKDKSKSCSIMWILLRSCWGKKKKRRARTRKLMPGCAREREQRSLSPSQHPPQNRPVNHLGCFDTLFIQLWLFDHEPSPAHRPRDRVKKCLMLKMFLIV